MAATVSRCFDFGQPWNALRPKRKTSRGKAGVANRQFFSGATEAKVCLTLPRFAYCREIFRATGDQRVARIHARLPGSHPGSRRYQGTENYWSQCWIMRSDGTQQHKLAEGATPRWSAAGKYLLFTREERGGQKGLYGIFAINSDGTGQGRIGDGR